MSSADNNRKRRLKKLRKWRPYQANLIYVLSKYPILYVPLSSCKKAHRHRKLNKLKWDNAWQEVSTEVGQTITACKVLWRSIKQKYAKIMNLIKIGKITKSDAIAHPETGRFLDGSLSFMDPYISEITDDDIAFTRHSTINDLFNLETVYPKGLINQHILVTHTQVRALLAKRELQENIDSRDILEAKNLQTTINNAVKWKLEELLQIKKRSNSYDDTINNEDEKDLNKNEDNASKAIHLGLQTELIIEDDIKVESDDKNIQMEDECGETLIITDESDNDNVEMNSRNDYFNIKMEDDGDVRDENSTMIDKNINDETVENVDFKYIVPRIIRTVGSTSADVNDDESYISDDDVRKFFSELGVVMSLELDIFKQNMLQTRINQLVRRDLKILAQPLPPPPPSTT